MTDKKERPGTGWDVPPELREQIDKGLREGLEQLAQEVEVHRLVTAEHGIDSARSATATHLIEQHSQSDVLSLLLIAIDHLAKEQDDAGVALAKIGEQARADAARSLAPEYGNGGYV